MKAILGICVVLAAYALLNGLSHGHQEYLAQIEKTEQVQKKLDEQKGVREANLKYMNDVVQTAQACTLIPFLFCPPQWQNLELANSYINQGISGVPNGKFYSILSIAILTKTLEYLLVTWVFVMGWRWAKAPPKRKVVEAHAIISKGEEWLGSIQLEMAPERASLASELEAMRKNVEWFTERNALLTQSNALLIAENEAHTMRNEELRQEHKKISTASEKLKMLFDKKADSSRSDDELTDS